MPKVATFVLVGSTTYSQSKPHLTDYLPNESHDDFRVRTWKNHLHVLNGEVFIPPGAIKNCLSEGAKFMSLGIPGKGKATYTKHFEAGILVVKPIFIGVKAEDVQSETLFLPSDGKRGSGKRVWKTMPVIHKWKGVVEVVILDETVLHTSPRTGTTILEEVLRGCGQYIGLGRYRPKNNGTNGRFSIENFEVAELVVAKAA